MKSVKILSIKKTGQKQGYNLRMRSSQHNYLLKEGLVSANSHSLAYGIITYWCAYLKAHYPVEFYTALLECEDKPEMISQYACSAKMAGIEILPPDINKSLVGNSVENGKIRLGLSKIKGMPTVAAEKILEVRRTQ